MVMALNFLHADCSFVSARALALTPNQAQLVALRNLKGSLKAFGSRAGDINVPACGRRSATLVAMLADLSDFFTKNGLSGTAYETGFEDAVGSNHVIEPDLSRAEELVPYRSLESRLVQVETFRNSPVGPLSVP